MLALAALGLSLLGGVVDTAKNTALLNIPNFGNSEVVREEKWKEKGVLQYNPTHRQMVWIYALEFCESSGNNNAVNPKDRDGTPSYYAFQWKPDTFIYYASKRYKIIRDDLEFADYMNLMSDYDLQLEIIKRMVGERDKIKWLNEFPVCVKKLGLPPKD